MEVLVMQARMRHFTFQTVAIEKAAIWTRPARRMEKHTGMVFGIPHPTITRIMITIAHQTMIAKQ
jgi:hypothetical protein